MPLLDRLNRRPGFWRLNDHKVGLSVCGGDKNINMKLLFVCTRTRRCICLGRTWKVLGLVRFRPKIFADQISGFHFREVWR